MSLAEQEREAEWRQRREEIEGLTRSLIMAVSAACPGPHAVKHHRDQKPPWCPKCGRDKLGRRQMT